MPANSLPRRIIKKLLAPLLPDSAYSRLQAVAMVRDIKDRTWWEPEIELAKLTLREGDSAIDIGANFGLWAYYLAQAVGRSGRVYAFEPLEFTAQTFDHVSRQLGFDKTVQLFRKGAAEKAGKVEFTVPVTDTGAISAGLVHVVGRDDRRPGQEKWARYSKTKSVMCDVVSIDEQLPNLERLQLLKCDIEGADLFAMKGARRTLEKHKPVVVIEANTFYLEGFGLTNADLLGFFEGLGYRCFHYDDDGTLTPASLDGPVDDNYVFVHPDNDERVRERYASNRELVSA